jgi:hypothetical protein
MEKKKNGKNEGGINQRQIAPGICAGTVLHVVGAGMFCGGLPYIKKGYSIIPATKLLVPVV